MEHALIRLCHVIHNLPFTPPKICTESIHLPFSVHNFKLVDRYANCFICKLFLYKLNSQHCGPCLIILCDFRVAGIVFATKTGCVQGFSILGRFIDFGCWLFVSNNFGIIIWMQGNSLCQLPAFWGCKYLEIFNCSPLVYVELILLSLC